jgi:hypothetical protein
MSLTREQLDKAPVTVEEVKVPEMNIEGGTVFVCKLDADGVVSLADLADNLRKSPSEAEQVKFLYRVVALTVSDAKGARLYRDDEADVIGRWPFEALERVAESALKLNGMDEATSDARTKELARPLAGSSSSSRGNGRARTAKRKAARHRKKSSSASR